MWYRFQLITYLYLSNFAFWCGSHLQDLVEKVYNLAVKCNILIVIIALPGKQDKTNT